MLQLSNGRPNYNATYLAFKRDQLEKLSNSVSADGAVPVANWVGAECILPSLYSDYEERQPIPPENNMLFSGQIRRNQFTKWIAKVWDIAMGDVILHTAEKRNEKVWKVRPRLAGEENEVEWAIELRRRPSKNNTWVVIMFPDRDKKGQLTPTGKTQTHRIRHRI